jgi:hypothetical protein
MATISVFSGRSQTDYGGVGSERSGDLKKVVMTASRSMFVSVLVLFCLFGVPRVRADVWNQATRVTFDESIEVPGRVLAAGTYWFTLLNDDEDRNIVQIWNADRMRLLATILTVPDYRLQPKGRTVMKFEERPSSEPQALEAWFYPGDNYGHEFVDPKTTAKELAKRFGRPVLSMRDDLSSNITKPAKSAKEPSVTALKHAQVEGVNPEGQEVSVANVLQTSPQGTH